MAKLSWNGREGQQNRYLHKTRARKVASSLAAPRDRNEKITDLLKDPATFSPPGGTGLRSETKELVDQMIEGAKSFSQSWTGYLTGLEQVCYFLVTVAGGVDRDSPGLSSYRNRLGADHRSGKPLCRSLPN